MEGHGPDVVGGVGAGGHVRGGVVNQGFSLRGFLLHNLPAVVLLHQLDLLLAVLVDHAVDVQIEVGAVALLVGEVVPPLLVPHDFLRLGAGVGVGDGLFVIVPAGDGGVGVEDGLDGVRAVISRRISARVDIVGAHGVVLVSDRGTILRPDGLEVLQIVQALNGRIVQAAFQHFPVAVASGHPDLLHRVRHHGALLVILGQVVEGEVGFLGAIRPQDHLDGGGGLAVVVLDGDVLGAGSAHGDGVAVGTTVGGDFPAGLRGKLQLEGQGQVFFIFFGVINGVQRIGENLETLVGIRILTAADPGLVDGHVHGAQAAVGDHVQGVHVGGDGGVIGQPLIGHLVAVVVGGDLEDVVVILVSCVALLPLAGGGDVALSVAVGDLGALADGLLHDVEVLGFKRVAFFVFQHLAGDVDKVRPGAGGVVDLMGDGLVAVHERLQVPSFLIRIVHPHRHRLPVEGVAVVDPVLLDHQDHLLAGAVGDDAGVVPRGGVVASLVTGGEAAFPTLGSGLQDEVVVQVAGLVVQGQVLDDGVPSGVVIRNSIRIFRVKVVDGLVACAEGHALWSRSRFHQRGGATVLGNLHRHIGLLEVEVIAGQGLVDVEGDVEPVFFSYAVPLLRQGEVHSVLHRVGDGGSVVCIRCGGRVDDVFGCLSVGCGLGQGEGGLAQIVSVDVDVGCTREVVAIHALVNRRFHPAVFQLLAVAVVQVQPAPGGGVGHALRGEVVEDAGDVLAILLVLFPVGVGVRVGVLRLHPDVQGELHRHVLEGRLVGGGLPDLGDGSRGRVGDPVGEGAAVVDQGVVGADSAVGQNVAALLDFARFRINLAKDLLVVVVPSLLGEILPHAVGVPLAVGVVLGEVEGFVIILVPELDAEFRLGGDLGFRSLFGGGGFLAALGRIGGLI